MSQGVPISPSVRSGGVAMSALVSPLHVAAIDGVDVRFFEAPTGRLELPWHSVDDLYDAMRFPPELKQIMLRRSRAFPGGDFATVPTASGPVVIQSHVMAQGIVGAAIEAGGLSASFEGRYAKAAASALEAMNRGFPLEMRLRRAMDAARNTLGLEADETAVSR